MQPFNFWPVLKGVIKFEKPLKSKIMKSQKLHIKFLLPLFIAFIITGPVFAQTVTETFELEEFSEIGLAEPFTVYLTQGPTQKVEVKGDKEVLDKIKRRVRGGEWSIDIDDKYCNKWRSERKEVRIYITIPEINGLSVAGSGEIVGETPIETRKLNTSVAGSGDIRVDVKADNIHSSVAGSGAIKISGRADKIKQSIAGSGEIYAFDLEVKRAKVSIAGSGNAEISVSEELDASVVGSGDVYYKGNPSLDVSVMGSGKVRSSD